MTNMTPPMTQSQKAGGITREMARANAEAMAAGGAHDLRVTSESGMRSNVRDQRRRAVGAPLADPFVSSPVPVPASGVPTRDDRCIA
jgi:hypothetical protein